MPVPRSIRAKLREAGFRFVDLGVGATPVFGNLEWVNVTLYLCDGVGDGDRVLWEEGDYYVLHSMRHPIGPMVEFQRVEGIDAAIVMAKEMLARATVTLSDDAKALCTGWWKHRISAAASIEFKTPNRITPRAKAALDELVAGQVVYQTEKDAGLFYVPHDIAHTIGRQQSAAWLKEHSFEVVTAAEDGPEFTLKLRRRAA